MEGHCGRMMGGKTGSGHGEGEGRSAEKLVRVWRVKHASKSHSKLYISVEDSAAIAVSDASIFRVSFPECLRD